MISPAIHPVLIKCDVILCGVPEQEHYIPPGLPAPEKPGHSFRGVQETKMQNRYFTDEELSAFLDGEADLTPVSEIRSALISDVVLAQRVNTLRMASQIIISCFDKMVPDRDRIPDFSTM